MSVIVSEPSPSFFKRRLEVDDTSNIEDLARTGPSEHIEDDAVEMEAIDAEYLQISHDHHQKETLCYNGQRAADLLMMGQRPRQTEYQEHGEVDQRSMRQTRGDKIAHAHKVHHLCRGISKEITEDFAFMLQS